MSIILGPPVGQNRVKTPERQIDPGPPGQGLSLWGRILKTWLKKGEGGGNFSQSRERHSTRILLGSGDWCYARLLGRICHKSWYMLGNGERERERNGCCIRWLTDEIGLVTVQESDHITQVFTGPGGRTRPWSVLKMADRREKKYSFLTHKTGFHNGLRLC